MNSKIKNKKAIKFGQELIISRFASPNIDTYVQDLKNQKPNITTDELNREVFEMVKRDSFYNALMDEVAKAYEFELDNSEVQERVGALTTSHPDLAQETAKNMVEVQIYKQLIYEDLEKEWELVVSDEQVKSSLENFYRETGQPIREYLVNKDKFEVVKRNLVEQIITHRLMNSFRPLYRFPTAEE